MTSVEPVSDAALAQIADSAQRYVDHVRPTSGEDLWAMNITSWMGERMSYVLARLTRAEQQLARLTEQSDLWHRGELDTTTAMAGIHGELHGAPLPDVGQWDRDRAAEQAAREQAAAEAAVGHCPLPYRFPCGHCAHDLCQDCSRCCTCKCPEGQD